MKIYQIKNLLMGTILFMMSSIVTAAEYEINTGIIFPEDSQYNQTGIFTARVGTPNWYGFASYFKHDQVRHTQNLGEFRGY